MHNPSHDGDRLVFADDQDVSSVAPQAAANLPGWKVLIVDDEEEIHRMTRFVLADLVFDGRPLAFYSAYNGAEAQAFLAEHTDTAVILLDVVMASEDDGLQVARYVRETLHNELVRIILRTGQPGHAPERRIILEYDINDYKEKTELTAQKLFTTMVAALRSYRDLQQLAVNKAGLQQILDSTDVIFKIQPMKSILQAIIQQLELLVNRYAGPFRNIGGFAAVKRLNDFVILAGTGKYGLFVGKRVTQVMADEVRMLLVDAVCNTSSQHSSYGYAAYFGSRDTEELVLYIDGFSELDALRRSLVDVFSRHVKVALENVYLQQELEDTQRDIIYTLSELSEASLDTTGHDSERISAYVRLLAERMGLEDDVIKLLEMAAPLHDIGKVTIPEAILRKRGPLTYEEFETVKTHTTVGYGLLKKSRRPVLKVAAILAHQHHEKYDGTGYPRGLSGNGIHVYARIMAAVDVFDALGSEREYRVAWSLDEIIRYFHEQRGKHFDPQVVDLLIKHLPEMLAIRDKYSD